MPETARQSSENTRQPETARQELLREVGLPEGLTGIEALQRIEKWAEDSPITVVYHMMARVGAHVYMEKP